MKVNSELHTKIYQLLDQVIAAARLEDTYADAIKFLKHEQDAAGREMLPPHPTEVDRQAFRLTSAIYGEAIYRIMDEAKQQKIKEG